jgi:hypothetical protein
MSTPKTKLVDTFAAVLVDILSVTRTKQNVLAQQLGVSTKTFGRYLNGQATPPPGRRHGIVHAFRDLPPPLLSRVAASLGVSDDFSHGLPHPKPAPEELGAVIEAALREVMVKLDTGPSRTRAALTNFLGRLAAAHVDPASAQAALANGT